MDRHALLGLAMTNQSVKDPGCSRPLPHPGKQIGPETSGLRANLWWALAARSFRCMLFGALAFAGRMLPDATLRSRRMFRSHGGTVPVVASRNLLSEAFSPGSDTSCRRRLAGRGADTPAKRLSRVGTVATGTAPACGRSLAPCYGSDLLTLRLHWLLQRGDSALRNRPS